MGISDMAESIIRQGFKSLVNENKSTLIAGAAILFHLRAHRLHLCVSRILGAGCEIRFAHLA